MAGQGAPREFLDLRREGESRGLIYGSDFAIWGVPTVLGSEVIIFGVDGDEYMVVYRDMGKSSEITRSTDFATTSDLFLEEAARLAGLRERGPYARRRPRSEYEGMTPKQVFEAFQREGKIPQEISWDAQPGAENDD